MTPPLAVTHLTVPERMERGKTARKRCPRSAHAAWEAPANRPDPIALLEAQAETRVPELVPIRYGRMLASPFAFYRGAATIMASDLATLPNTALNVQLCGDAHLSNFGGFASPERDLVLDLNDFDETLPGPWEWDLKRLAASIEIACRERGLASKERRRLVLEAAGEYQQAMAEFAAMGHLAVWSLHLDLAAMRQRWGMGAAARTMKTLDADFAQARHRDNQRAFEKLTVLMDGQPRIAARPPLVVPIEDIAPNLEPEKIEHDIRALIRGYRRSLQADRRHLLETYDYLHLARKVVGVGSVGTRTWIALLRGRDDNDPLFLQVKEAQASVLEPYLGKSAYADHGERVVEGQRLMQAASDIFLGWERVAEGLDGKPRDFYVRQLWDWKISVDVEVMAPDEISIYSRMCGWTLARAHARSGDPIAISSYMGEKSSFPEALAEFAAAYADQNQRDYQALADAVKEGRIKAETGV